MSRAAVKPARRLNCDVLHGDQHVVFRGAVGLARVEHVRVRVDQARQNGCRAQVDHLGVRRNLDLTLRPDFGDSIARNDHYLFRQHLASLAVEQAAGADGDESRRRRALQNPAIGTYARCCSRASPGSGQRLGLRTRARPYRAQRLSQLWIA